MIPSPDETKIESSEETKKESSEEGKKDDKTDNDKSDEQKQTEADLAIDKVKDKLKDIPKPGNQEENNMGD